MRQFTPCLLAPLLALAMTGEKTESRQRMEDAGFEDARPGKLESTTTGKGWEVQRVGRPAIQVRLLVECVGDEKRAKVEKQFLKLGLPKDTVGFEFVTVGQRLALRGDREYEASVWVCWPDGPEKAPAKADATSAHPSAIVSIWARHREATGDFAGRYVWLFDRQWKKLTFRFRATDPDQKTLIYVSLLPNQTPRETTLLVDEFTLTETEAPVAAARSKGECVRDGGFAELKAGKIGFGTWSFANIGGTRILGEVVEAKENKFVRIAMNRQTTNFESAQLWQMLELEKGVRYEVRCRMRWDNARKGQGTPLVNFGLYHEATNTWYGPIDQALKPSADWESYPFVHVPPHEGKWKLYVQLNGWGNFGNALTVSSDDFSYRAGVAPKK